MKERRRLRMQLFEAVAKNDHHSVRSLLYATLETLGSKMLLEMLIHKMYSSPTLWLWSFAFTTYNPLHVACRLGDVEMVELLLNNGFNANLLDKIAGEPLTLRQIFEMCRGRPANITNIVASPLHVAVMHGHTNVIDVLTRPGYEGNSLCMEELAFAKEVQVPVVAISCGKMNLSEELQVYLFTRQIIPFGDAIDMKERILAAKDAILQSSVFLVVLSEQSVKTELVSDQLAFAEDKGKLIVPVYYSKRPDLLDSTLRQLLEQERGALVFGNDLSFGRGFEELMEELWTVIQDLESANTPVASLQAVASDSRLHISPGTQAAARLFLQKSRAKAASAESRATMT
ncbi:hypothetical protein P43SY_005009 [Pythium insidiosum]|uniref:TIR domain-containing protein n=1 Tax=Pythium insidiosum TaxID=114742 RepID=A0AAD5LR21_PYTIN|nr:hypothetical protein P43SY_005009 [Pythium insidiosum]